MSSFGQTVRCYAPSGKMRLIRQVCPASALVFTSWSTLSTRIPLILPSHGLDVTFSIFSRSTEAVGGRDRPHRHASRLGRARPRCVRHTEMYKSRLVDHAFRPGPGFNVPLMSLPVPPVDFSCRDASDQFLDSGPSPFPQPWDSVSLSTIVNLYDVTSKFLTSVFVLAAAADVPAGVAPVPIPSPSPPSVAIAASTTTAIPAM